MFQPLVDKSNLMDNFNFDKGLIKIITTSKLVCDQKFMFFGGLKWTSIHCEEE
jgi:hypothetical protein